jgi:hypothetical protein
MDTASITARIEQAIRHAADGNRLINRQREIIAGLERLPGLLQIFCKQFAR